MIEIRAEEIYPQAFLADPLAYAQAARTKREQFFKEPKQRPIPKAGPIIIRTRRKKMPVVISLPFDQASYLAVQFAMKRGGCAKSGRLRAKEILAHVARERGIPVRQILGKSRLGPIALARQVAMARVRKELNKSHPWIGRYFKRDHSTVVHACQKIERLGLLK